MNPPQRRENVLNSQTRFRNTKQALMAVTLTSCFPQAVDGSDGGYSAEGEIVVVYLFTEMR